jgi:hypothetical protein
MSVDLSAGISSVILPEETCRISEDAQGRVRR